MKIAGFVFFAISFAPFAVAEDRGVIDDPDGYVNVRAEKNAEAAISATVKPNEPFAFKCEENAEWCRVTLASGQAGWIAFFSRRRIYPRGMIRVRKSTTSRGDVASVTRQ